MMVHFHEELASGAPVAYISGMVNRQLPTQVMRYEGGGRGEQPFAWRPPKAPSALWLSF